MVSLTFSGTNNPSFISVIQEKATSNVPLLLCNEFQPQTWSTHRHGKHTSRESSLFPRFSLQALPSVEIWYPVHIGIVAVTREIVYLKHIFTLVCIETSHETLSLYTPLSLLLSQPSLSKILQIKHIL